MVDGCFPIPNNEGNLSDPGRARVMDKKRYPGEDEVGVIPKRLEAKTAPSGLSDVPAGTFCAMTELRGSASPRIPSNKFARGSEDMELAAAEHMMIRWVHCHGYGHLSCSHDA